MEKNINKADEYRLDNNKEMKQKKNTNNISKRMTKRIEKQKINNKVEEDEKDEESIFSESELEGQLIKQQQEKYRKEMNNKIDEDKESASETKYEKDIEEEESNYDSTTESDNEVEHMEYDSDEVADCSSEAFTSFQSTDELADAFGNITDRVNISPRVGASYNGGRAPSRGRNQKNTYRTLNWKVQVHNQFLISALS
ncbi:hypothetical protein KY289_016933 [Solanum tuberosum]|nr:hypothetical protein KY284_016722 [Solanum tuberosum]KAH0689575.1 hypothetical protein KY289_016933 [Solanum tuberosum]